MGQVNIPPFDKNIKNWTISFFLYLQPLARCYKNRMQSSWCKGLCRTLRLSGSSVRPAYPGFIVMKMPQFLLHVIMLPMNIRDSLCALKAFRIDSTWFKTRTIYQSVHYSAIRAGEGSTLIAWGCKKWNGLSYIKRLRFIRKIPIIDAGTALACPKCAQSYHHKFPYVASPFQNSTFSSHTWCLMWEEL